MAKPQQVLVEFSNRDPELHAKLKLAFARLIAIRQYRVAESVVDIGDAELTVISASKAQLRMHVGIERAFAVTKARVVARHHQRLIARRAIEARPELRRIASDAGLLEKVRELKRFGLDEDQAFRQYACYVR